MYEDLYQKNKGMLHLMARRWAARCTLDPAVSVEDLAQAGFFGLVKAAETYRADAGKGWFTWACRYIRREFERTLFIYSGRITRPHTNARSLDAPTMSTDGEGDPLIDQLADESLPDIDAGALSDDLRDSIQAALQDLQDLRGRQIVQGCDLDGKSYSAMGKELGVSGERVRQIRYKALKALKKDERLRAHAEGMTLDDLTKFHAHKGVSAFMRDLTSTTEAAALWRIDHQRTASK